MAMTTAADQEGHVVTELKKGSRVTGGDRESLSGQLKKKVLRFLDQKEIKQLYHRVEKDGDNWGRLFIHFRHESGQQRGRGRR